VNPAPSVYARPCPVCRSYCRRLIAIFRLAPFGSSPDGGISTISPLTSSALPSTLWRSSIVARVLVLIVEPPVLVTPVSTTVIISASPLHVPPRRADLVSPSGGKQCRIMQLRNHHSFDNLLDIMHPDVQPPSCAMQGGRSGSSRRDKVGCRSAAPGHGLEL